LLSCDTVQTLKEDRYADNVSTTQETSQETHDTVDLDIRSVDQIFAKSQVADYIHRGTALEDYNVLDFFVKTYEKKITKSQTLARGAQNHVPYMSNYHKNAHCFRVIRRAGHRNLPNFVGRFFPRNDDPSTYEFYCASMLTLLKPWRHLNADLKPIDATWEQTFQMFLTSASDIVLRVISGIQYFHECDLAAKSKKEHRTAFDSFVNRSAEYDAETREQDYDGSETAEERTSTITEEDLKECLANSTPIREQLHATNALAIAEHVGIFSSLQSTWIVHPCNRLRNAEEADFKLLSQWQLHIEKEVERVNNINALQSESSEESIPSQGNVQAISPDSLSQGPSVVLIQSEVEIPSMNPNGLNREQRRTYEIVKDHLQQSLLGEQTRPLRMILYGEGGTGKSKVIQTISEAFLNAGEIHGHLNLLS
jgi:hypothetical protein